MKKDELEFNDDLAEDALVINCSTRHNNNHQVPGDFYNNGYCIGATDDLCLYDLLDNIQNDTHTLTHMLMSLISIAQDMRDRSVHNTKHGGHDDAQPESTTARIVVTFESSDMTQEIGSADVSNDGIHATGVNLGINRIDKRINITDALKGIINTINSTPEVRR